MLSPVPKVSQKDIDTAHSLMLLVSLRLRWTSISSPLSVTADGLAQGCANGRAEKLIACCMPCAWTPALLAGDPAGTSSKCTISFGMPPVNLYAAIWMQQAETFVQGYIFHQSAYQGPACGCRGRARAPWPSMTASICDCFGVLESDINAPSLTTSPSMGSPDRGHNRFLPVISSDSSQVCTVLHGCHGSRSPQRLAVDIVSLSAGGEVAQPLTGITTTARAILGHSAGLAAGRVTTNSRASC